MRIAVKIIPHSSKMRGFEASYLSLRFLQDLHQLFLYYPLTPFPTKLRKGNVFSRIYLPDSTTLLYPDSGISMDEEIVLGDMTWSYNKAEL